MNLNKNKNRKSNYSSLHKEEESGTGVNQRLILQLLILFAYAFVLFLVCFFGESPAGPKILPNQITQIRIVAELPFSYESKIRTDRLMAKKRHLVVPVYDLDMRPYESFESKVEGFLNDLNTLEVDLVSLDEEKKIARLDEFLFDVKEDYKLVLQKDDVTAILERLDRNIRNSVFEDGLSYLEEIMSEGVISTREMNYDNDLQTQPFFKVEIDGKQGESQIQTEEEAHFSLRRYLRFLNIDYKAFQSVFKILNAGLTVNLTYDLEKTETKVDKVLSNVKPVVIQVAEGDSITEPGSVFTPEQNEMLTAYRKELRKTGDYFYGFSQVSPMRFITTFFIIIFSLLYIKLVLREDNFYKKKTVLLAIVLLLNLMIVRLFLYLGETNLFMESPELLAILPYMAPVALGPILINLTLGVRFAILNTLLVCFFNGLMQGDNINIFVLTLLATGVIVYQSKNARLRAKVIRASVLGGIVTVLGVFLNSFFNDIMWPTVIQQMLCAFIVSILTGVFAVMFLPLIEKTFKYTSNIVLFELADFNHPLLRRLQMIAPGTYHHSLMVANLSERAAVEIGANPIICRAASLFHDIGKIEKPNYFTENQTDKINPHEERSPSVSALVIKSHVKDGVAIAKAAKLPNVIIDVIEQHHGTSLIQFFYSKALLKQKSTQCVLPLEGEDTEFDIAVDEATYRYDGPRPNFKESAIIHLADSIEAAGRSLPKVTHQSVNDLVTAIFEDRITDHQLDDCPLTLQEISKLKKSFSFSLFNMLHSRVKYPSLSDEVVD